MDGREQIVDMRREVGWMPEERGRAEEMNVGGENNGWWMGEEMRMGEREVEGLGDGGKGDSVRRDYERRDYGREGEIRGVELGVKWVRRV